MIVDINLGDEFTQSEIEKKFNTKFGHSIRGISLRNWDNETKYIILTSSANSPYSDNFEGNIIYYDGEGQNKHQKETDANVGLIKSNENNRPIYFFKQYETKGKWKYLGIMEVLDYNYVEKNGFMTYEFKLKKTNLNIPPDTSVEQKEINDLILKEPILTDDNGFSNYKRKKRSAAFSRTIKKNYDNSCAVCGKKRFTNSGYPEVEAAHIYPKSKKGADDPRNGISLCKFHHWAFDNGLFSIRDDYSIQINPRIVDDDNYEEITMYKDKKIHLPSKKEYKPDILYLSEHRKLHKQY